MVTTYIPMNRNTQTGGRVIKPSIPEIIQSDLLAKATIKFLDGSVKIVAVYSCSHYYNFFMIFSAKSTRTRRNNWKLVSNGIIYQQGKIFGLKDAALAATICAGPVSKITYKYIIGKRAFEVAVDKIGNPMKYTTPQTSLEPGQSTRLVEKRLQNGRAGRMSILKYR